jgi:hypothetical protein
MNGEKDYVTTTIRIPKDLHVRLKALIGIARLKSIQAAAIDGLEWEVKLEIEGLPEDSAKQILELPALLKKQAI